MIRNLPLLLCLMLPPGLAGAQFWEQHWTDSNYVFSGSGGDVLTVVQTDCEEGFVQVADTANVPLPAFSPIIINPMDANGDDITDISAGPVSINMRLRSLEAVEVGALFRSGDGSGDFRTEILYADVPAGLEEWTEITIEFSGDDLAGFDAADLRDVWLFLDRGEENFAGNELYIDYVSLGGPPTPGLESPCPLGGPGIGFWEQHWIDSNYVFSGSGGDVLTVVQTDCQEGFVQVADTANVPLPAFSPIIINPMDANGEDLTDISAGPVSINMRLRSLEAVEVGALFRSGDGSGDFRTEILYADVPAGLEEWTEITIEFSGDDLAGFDAADLRDVWLFLDRGDENFAGNELYIDYVSLGGTPTPGLESPCPLGGPGIGFWEQHWIDSNYVFSGSGGDALTVVQTDCQEGFVQVADPANAPLPAFSPIIINPMDANGDDITDISAGPVSITMRLRSLEAVEVGALFRAGDGSSDFRTEILYADVPAGLEQWTEVTIEFSGDDLAGFDDTDLRDVWLFLDRGEENFAGNELYIDYVSLGGQPTPGLESPCSLIAGVPGPFFDYFDADSLVSINTSSIAGEVTTFSLDTDCETLLLTVTDPINAPLPPFNAYFIDPADSSGTDITDLTEEVSLTMRVRSAEAVTLDVLFRSGEGGGSERSDRKSVDIPGGLEEWTTVTLNFDESDYAGFDPADLRDVWFYLDRGTENFAGNEFYIDHIAVGALPDTTRNTSCSTIVGPQTWSENWNTDDPTVLGGSETAKLNLSVNDCEEISVAVADPVNAPHQAFRPVVINPQTESGVDITNITGNVQVVIRARSAEDLPLGVLLRSGDGSTDFRTATLTETVIGRLDAYSLLTYTFEGDDLGGFVADDFRDLWLFLDQEEDNFPGNELYIDYIAIGPEPDTMMSSPCGLPDIVVGTSDAARQLEFSVFPNPTDGRIHIHWSQKIHQPMTLQCFNTYGQLIWQQQYIAEEQVTKDLSLLPAGVYWIRLGNGVNWSVRRVVRR